MILSTQAKCYSGVVLTQTMSENTDHISRAEFAKFANRVINTLVELAHNNAKSLEITDKVLTNTIKGFTHIHKRLDDIDRRLEMIEIRSKVMEGDIVDIKADVHQVKNDDRNVAQVFELLETDGEEIAELRKQVMALDARLGEES